MAMPSAGDLVVYGTETPEGHVSYIDEVGAHAGPSREELHTFLVAPKDSRLPARIDHPAQLYEMFIQYQTPEPETAPDVGPTSDTLTLRQQRHIMPARRVSAAG